MKKSIVFGAIIVFLILFVACEKESENKVTVSTEIEHTQEQLATSIHNQEQNLKEDETNNDIGGGYIESDKYRLRYYAIPYEFVCLVDKEEYLKWKENILTQNDNDVNIMRMVRFIKDFNISKEDFEKANLKMAKDFVAWEEKPTLRPLDYENQQTYEIYNVDIIYSFDNELINEYYLTPDYPYCAEFEFEAAVKRGEYTSQTEEWVDIEEMETEINAKYGKPESTTQVTTSFELLLDATRTHRKELPLTCAYEMMKRHYKSPSFRQFEN